MGWSLTPFMPSAAIRESSSFQPSKSGCMQPKDHSPVSGARSFIRAEASLTWTTCRALVATGRTRQPATPALFMEARSPASVPSEKATVWHMDWSFSMVGRAILSGKV